MDPIEEAHIPALVAIEANVFPDPWPTSAFESILLEDHLMGWVHMSDGCPVAYAVVITVLDQWNLVNFAVDPAHQHKGLGRALLSDLQERAMASDIAQIHLEVRASNQAAIHLYKKLRFETTGLRPGFYERPCEDAVLMCWDRPTG